ncbi:hypothetical protein HK104_002316 [Borealophlyctis nickersoniae]|nr:hypothetical protein HK104_002316 [Borealophlyctis nickersoniae]
MVNPTLFPAAVTAFLLALSAPLSTTAQSTRTTTTTRPAVSTTTGAAGASPSASLPPTSPGAAVPAAGTGPIGPVASLTPGTPQADGNCVTGRINFDPRRIYVLKQDKVRPPDLNYNTVDMILNYGFDSCNYTSPGSGDGPYPFTINVVPRPGGGVGYSAKLSTSRWIKYGKITARMRGSVVPGVVTAFTTMSAVEDEIDFEAVGKDGSSIQSNVFFRGRKEMGVHGATHPVPGGGVGEYHEYTIDWKSDSLTFLIDNQVVRTVTLGSEDSKSTMLQPGEHWYPSTPSLVEIALWDAAGNGDATMAWAGGPIPWSSNPSVEAVWDWIDIQCYDTNNNAVPEWPVGSKGTNNTLMGVSDYGRPILVAAGKDGSVQWEAPPNPGQPKFNPNGAGKAFVGVSAVVAFVVGACAFLW